MNLFKYRHVAASVAMIAILALSGCVDRPVTGPVGEPSKSAAERAIARGDFIVAANEYAALADKAEAPDQQDLRLRAAELYVRGGHATQALKLLQVINVSRLSASFKARAKIVRAQLEAHLGNYPKAVILLNAASRYPALPPEVLAQLHWERAQAYIALDQHLGAARDLVLRERALADKQAIYNNQLYLWKMLAEIDARSLADHARKTSDPVLAGWLELAQLNARFARQPRRLDKALDRWHARYEKHPVDRRLLRALTDRQPTLIGDVNRVALLLPLSSRHKRAAEAVRDGFVAMHKASRRHTKPTIVIYDIGEDPKNAVTIYRRAVKEGAQLIIGPLGTQASEAVARTNDFTVPTILLSHTNQEISEPHVFQFALSPEQEARQVAERAYLDGKRQAAVIYPQGDWGVRMRNAFSEYWLRLGGVMIKAQAYDNSAGDHSEAIRDMLGVTHSNERRRLLQERLRTRIEFEPRSRADIDFIFIAANAKQARLIKPQIAYYQSQHITLYATSHIYFGRVDETADIDLNNIIFADMPWLLIDDDAMKRLRARVQGEWIYAHTPLDRLYAFGMDAYAIIPHLNRIAAREGARFNGVSSGLSIDPQGRIQRQLIWARFRRGRPQIIDRFLKYREHLNTSDARDTITPARRQPG